ncbi:MAG TPA: large conductance mechanosensitive channel protein MscL [Haliangiales bacterium]|nr:large conductance mechanosensitive channel protein MscL [Haliangiales bacterium]
MALWKEFKEFALKGNVIDLAVAVVIGALFGDVVKAAVDDIVMPIVGAVTPQTGWEAWTVTPLNFKVGHILSVLIKLVIIAFVLFLIVKGIKTAMAKMEAAPPPPPPNTRECPMCLEPIAKAAKRCKFCCADVTPA